MSRFEAMKAATGKGKSPPVPDPPKDDGPAVRFKCGHQKLVKRFAGSDCPGCLDKARQAQAAARKARSAERRAKAAAAGAEIRDAARLPDGSRFDVRYAAETQTWAGGLHVPGLPTFEGTASGVFKLLSALDARYRDHLKATQEG